MLSDLLFANLFLETDMLEVALSRFLSCLPKAAFKEFIVLLIEVNISEIIYLLTDETNKEK